ARDQLLKGCGAPRHAVSLSKPGSFCFAESDSFAGVEPDTLRISESELEAVSEFFELESSVDFAAECVIRNTLPRVPRPPTLTNKLPSGPTSMSVGAKPNAPSAFRNWIGSVFQLTPSAWSGSACTRPNVQSATNSASRYGA